VFNILRARRGSNATGPDALSQPGEGHVVDRLAKIADMLDKGLITSEEFAALKSGLLAEQIDNT
jgi:hypothetical protein